MRVFCAYCGKKLRRTARAVEEGGLFFCSPSEWGRFRHEQAQALKEKQEVDKTCRMAIRKNQKV